ncbi:MAG: alpha-E domain-containing protein [Deltaproteobacteria bacterium]|nr:alpha-E domain-containing protein [Deltaproteobacteria bacterium]
MISRVAENAFWLSRYVERIESLARLLYVNTQFVLDVTIEDIQRWSPLVVVVGEEERFQKAIDKNQQDDEETVRSFLTWDRTNPSSIACSIESARENARIIRETISLEMWETLNGLWLWFSDPKAEKLYRADQYSFFRYIRDQCVLFNGFALDTMLQSEAFNFMRLGASLERTGQTARILDVKYHALGPTRGGIELPMEIAQWQAILRSCSAIEPYFKVSYGELSGIHVANFLLFDKHFPRSVTRSLDRAWNFMQLIRPRGHKEIGQQSAKILKSLIQEMSSLTMDDVMEKGLHKKLTWIVDSVTDVCRVITSDYFTAQMMEPNSKDGSL